MPPAAVLRLANQLAVFPGALEQYGRRAQTRSDHLNCGMEAHHLDLSMLPRERRRFLATLGRRSTVRGN